MQMQAVKSLDNLNQEQLLGYMVFYYIPELKIKHAELEDIFDNNHVDKKNLPSKIQEHDAFRRATGKIKGSINVTLPDGSNKDAKLNVDEVRNDNDKIVRVLGRKIANASIDDVEYSAVGHMFFDKATKTMDWSVLSYTSAEHDYEKLLVDTTDTYIEWTQYHTKDTVRTIINKIVKDMQPVSIIKGAYFIPKHEYDIIKGLKGIINDLVQYSTDSNGEIPGIEIIPLLDTVEQRDMIKAKASKEMIGEIDNVLTELSDMLSEGKEIHTRTIGRISAQFNELKSKKQTYANLLNIKMDAVGQLLMSAIDKFTKMQVDKKANIEVEESDLVEKTE